MKIEMLLRKSALPIFYRSYSCSGTKAQTADPFANVGKDRGRLVVYGQSTSRVTKVNGYQLMTRRH